MADYSHIQRALDTSPQQASVEKPRYRIDIEGVANAIKHAYYNGDGHVADGTDIWHWCALHAVVHLAATHRIHFEDPGQSRTAPPQAGT